MTEQHTGNPQTSGKPSLAEKTTGVRALTAIFCLTLLAFSLFVAWHVIPRVYAPFWYYATSVVKKLLWCLGILFFMGALSFFGPRTAWVITFVCIPIPWLIGLSASEPNLVVLYAIVSEFVCLFLGDRLFWFVASRSERGRMNLVRTFGYFSIYWVLPFACLVTLFSTSRVVSDDALGAFALSAPFAFLFAYIRASAQKPNRSKRKK